MPGHHHRWGTRSGREISPGLPASSLEQESWPHFEADEIEAVVDVLRSGHVNAWTGRETSLFEEEFGAYLGARHAVAVANGTVALEIALHALGIQPKDEVIVPARSFFATASAVIRLGAVPVFADVDRNTQGISAETVEPCLSERSRAIICVHLAGHPCEIQPLLDLCRDHHLPLLEDCAQAHGATYRGRPVGTWGDLGCFSFCQDKIITTGGEGGMVVTNSNELWDKAWSFKDHGKSRRAVFEDHHPPGFRWYHDSFGTNLRLTEMQAAIGRRQLVKLETWVERRRRNARILYQKLSDHPLLRFPFEAPHVRHVFYKLYFFIRPDRLARSWSRNRLIKEINAVDIACISGICPEIYRERAFQGTSFVPRHRLKIAKELGETSLMFDVHPTLSRRTQRSRAQKLRLLFDRATAS